MNVKKHNQQITATDMHWRIKSFVHWKHVHLVHGLGTFFPNKFGLRMLVWDHEFFFATRHAKVVLIAIFGIKQCSSGHTDSHDRN